MRDDGLTVDEDVRTDIARYHREHERYYAIEDLRRATELKRWGRALWVLADHWANLTPDDVQEHQEVGAQAAVAGCEDLNAFHAISNTGILFMEGESRPFELSVLEGWCAELGPALVEAGDWLAEKMDAGWDRESTLTGGPHEHLVPARFRALTVTTLNALRMRMAGELILLARRHLQRTELTPEAVRSAPTLASQVLESTGWLLDRAGVLLADKSNDASNSQMAWTAFLRQAGSDGG